MLLFSDMQVINNSVKEAYLTIIKVSHSVDFFKNLATAAFILAIHLGVKLIKNWLLTLLIPMYSWTIVSLL